MIKIRKHKGAVLVTQEKQLRGCFSVDELAYFDCSYGAENIAQEVLELLAALCHEAKIVDGTNEDSD
jgi:hypothetical protein